MNIFRVRYPDITYLLGMPVKLQFMPSSRNMEEQILRPEEIDPTSIFLINFLDYITSESSGNYKERIEGKNYKQAISFLHDYIFKDFVNIESLHELYQLFIEDVLKISLRQPLLNDCPCTIRPTIPLDLEKHFIADSLSNYNVDTSATEFNEFVVKLFSIYTRLAYKDNITEKFIKERIEKLKDPIYSETLCRINFYMSVLEKKKLIFLNREETLR